MCIHIQVKDVEAIWLKTSGVTNEDHTALYRCLNYKAY